MVAVLTSRLDGPHDGSCQALRVSYMYVTLAVKFADITSCLPIKGSHENTTDITVCTVSQKKELAILICNKTSPSVSFSHNAQRRIQTDGQTDIIMPLLTPI